MLIHFVVFYCTFGIRITNFFPKVFFLRKFYKFKNLVSVHKSVDTVDINCPGCQILLLKLFLKNWS